MIEYLWVVHPVSKKLIRIARSKPNRKVQDPRVVHKIKDEITRILYYAIVGYGGPHPWGPKARPPYPEYQTLKVMDDKAGTDIRDAISKILNGPRYNTMLRSMLRDLDSEVGNK